MPGRLNPRWVARGLVLVVLGDLWITPSGSRAMTPVNNPGRTVGTRGRTTGYGSTDAGNTTARYDGFTLPNSAKGPRSYFGTILARSTGGGALGRVTQDSTNAGGNNIGEEAIYFISGRLMLSKVGNTTNSPLQVGPTPTTPLGSWSSFGFSCNFVPGAAQNAADIVCYQNGALQANTVNAAPGQVYPEFAASNPVFGNRPSDSARTWDGQIGVIAVFDATLTASEQSSLHANPAQLLASGPQVLLAPVTATGATVYRPGSDLIVNGWTPSTGSDLFAMLDETTLDRGDFITSPNVTSPVTMGWTAPLAAGTYDISVDFDRTGATGQLRIVLLDSGGATVGTSSWQTAPASAATTVFNVTTTGTSDRFRIEVQA